MNLVKLEFKEIDVGIIEYMIINKKPLEGLDNIIKELK